MRNLVALFLAFCFALVAFPLQAQVPPVTQYTGSMTSPGNSHVVALNGYSTCSVGLSGTASGFSLTYQGSSDNGTTWNTITSMGTSGTETSLVTDTGNVVSQSTGATLLFRFALASISAGTLNYTESCSSAVGLGGGGSGANVTIVGLSSPNPFPVTCISGCSSSGSFTTPLPIASAGVAPATTPLPLNLTYPLCYYPAGATPNLTGGTTIALECGANGALNTNVIGTVPVSLATTIPVSLASLPPPVQPSPIYTMQVNTPAPVATIFVVNTPGVLVFNTTPPTALPTATAGVVATSAPPVLAEDSCIFPVGGTPNVTAGRIILLQCTANGALQVSGTLTVNTPVPVATVFVANTPGVTVQNTPGVFVYNTPAVVFPSSQPVSVSNASPIPVTTSAPQVLPSSANGLLVDINNLASPNPFPVTCISGCSSSVAFSTPVPIASAGASPATTALPVQLSYPICYFPAGATPNLTGGNTIFLECGSNGALNVNVVGTVTVNTPAPVATVFIVNTPAVNQGTSPWVVTTPAPAATDASGGIKVSIVNQASPVPLIVTTPAPVATIFIANTPGVTVQNTPGVFVYNTPGVICISGCSGGAAATAAPIATAGVVPTAAPPVVAESACYYPLGGTPNLTPGNIILLQCTVNGALQVSGTLTVNTPAPVATVFIVNTPSVLVANTTAPVVAPTATAGVAPGSALLVNAQISCNYPLGGTPNVTAGNVILAQCNANGAQLVTGTLTVNTPAPIATVFIANTPGVTVQNTPGVFVYNTPAVAPVATIAPQTVTVTPSPTAAPTMLPVEGFTQAQGSTGWWPLIFSDQSVVISDSSSGETQLVALASGKAIYVTGFSFQSAGTVNVNFALATGGSCASPTAVTGAYQEVANTGISVANSLTPYFIIPAGDALCINLSASVGVYGLLEYAQR